VLESRQYAPSGFKMKVKHSHSLESLCPLCNCSLNFSALCKFRTETHRSVWQVHLENREFFRDQQARATQQCLRSWWLQVVRFLLLWLVVDCLGVVTELFVWRGMGIGGAVKFGYFKVSMPSLKGCSV